MGEDKKERGRSRVKNTAAASNDSGETNLNDLNELVKKVITKLENITKIVEYNAKSCEESFKSFEFAQGEMTDKLNGIVKDLEEIKGENKSLKNENSKLKKTVINLTKKVENFDQKFEMLEREAKRSNLCIDGVVEREGLNLIRLVNDLFRDLEIDLKAEEVCHAIFRKGKAAEVENGVGTKPRPVIIQFNDPSVKGRIFKNLRKLAGNNTWSNVFINDDMTPDQIGKMKDMRAIHYYAKSLGRKTNLKGSTLYVDDKRYNLDEIDEVPKEISIEKAKNIEIEGGNGLVFQGHHSCLSNMYESEFVYEGREFISSEIAFQFKKAKENGQVEMAEKIKKCGDSYNAKRMGRKIKENDKWNEKKEKVMKEIVKAKFEQNEKIKKTLIETKEKKLCEGTGDRYWGCGVAIAKSSSIDLKKLPGKNTLGNILMEVRRDLTKK